MDEATTPPKSPRTTAEPAWLQMNRKAWDARTRVHRDSAFYDVAGFKAGRCTLKPIELEEVGSVAGRSLLHLQCHFGLDTLSFARRGARAVGLDFSPEAIETARGLAAELALPARFVCANVYDAPAAVNETFDVVFTSYGVLGWLPDLVPWARAVRACLKPGGRLHLVEFHPFLWMLDDALERVAYPYDSAGTPIIEVSKGTYAERSASVVLEDHAWNHSLGTVFTALLQAGLSITSFREHLYSPYDIFPDMEEREPGRFSPRKWEGRAPLVYSLVAVAPNAG